MILIYAATYASLRTGKVLVHREYLVWDGLAPEYATGGGYVERSDIGHGPVFDIHGHPTSTLFNRGAQIAFWPLMQAELWYWRHHAA